MKFPKTPRVKKRKILLATLIGFLVYCAFTLISHQKLTLRIPLFDSNINKVETSIVDGKPITLVSFNKCLHDCMHYIIKQNGERIALPSVDQSSANVIDAKYIEENRVEDPLVIMTRYDISIFNIEVAPYTHDLNIITPVYKIDRTKIPQLIMLEDSVQFSIQTEMPGEIIIDNKSYGIPKVSPFNIELPLEHGSNNFEFIFKGVNGNAISEILTTQVYNFDKVTFKCEEDYTFKIPRNEHTSDPFQQKFIEEFKYTGKAYSPGMQLCEALFYGYVNYDFFGNDGMGLNVEYNPQVLPYEYMNEFDLGINNIYDSEEYVTQKGLKGTLYIPKSNTQYEPTAVRIYSFELANGKLSFYVRDRGMNNYEFTTLQNEFITKVLNDIEKK